MTNFEANLASNIAIETHYSSGRIYAKWHDGTRKSVRYEAALGERANHEAAARILLAKLQHDNRCNGPHWPVAEKAIFMGLETAKGWNFGVCDVTCTE